MKTVGKFDGYLNLVWYPPGFRH